MVNRVEPARLKSAIVLAQYPAIPVRPCSGVAFVPDINMPRRPLVAAALLALALGGCSMSSLDGFSVAELNPLKGDDPLRSSDYNYFYRRDSAARGGGQVTAADLVGPDGRCAFEAAPAAPAPGPVGEPVAAAPAAAPAADPINPRSSQALYFTAGPAAGGPAGADQLPPQVRSGPTGIALSMTECQVVGVAGYTNQVQIGANERGERTAVLTYLSGDRPGIYHFRSGRLVNMERVAEPVQPKKPQRAAKQAKAKQRR
jgi:hypothetical protein